MATLKFEYDSKDFDFMNQLRKQFPELRAQTMGFVGKEGKLLLKKKFLSGQEIDLFRAGKVSSTDMKDSRGFRAVSYSIGKNAKYVKGDKLHPF